MKTIAKIAGIPPQQAKTRLAGDPVAKIADIENTELVFNFGISGDLGNFGNLSRRFPRVNYFATPLRVR